MTTRKYLLALSCVTIMTLPALAATPESDQPVPAPQFYDPRAVAHLSIAELEQRAEQQDAQAMAELGARYGRGAGVKKDYKKAMELLQAAADKNDPDAEYFIGTAYSNGLGVTQNDAEASAWYEKAAAHGQPAAEFVLATMITKGTVGMSKSWSGAIRYLWDSAAKDYPPAQFMLGYAYQLGLGVDVNPRAAAYWYRRSNSLLPNIRAQYNLMALIADGKIPWEEGDPGPQPAAASPQTAAP